MGRVNASAFPVAGQRTARVDHKAIETTLGALRLLAAAAVLFLGQAVPNVGPLFVLVLGIFFAGYGLLVMLAWARVRSAADRERASRFSLAADISLIGFALFVFAPDPSWTIYACGFLVIASGGIRFPSGALLAAASLSLAYVVVMAFRATTLGIPLSAPLALLQLAGYLAAGTLLNAVLPELDALREREHDTYEPILQAQDDEGEAVLVIEAGRPTYWNKAFEALTGYTQDDLVEGTAMSDLVIGDDAFPMTAAGEGPFHAQVRTRDGTTVEVDLMRRPAPASDGDRRVWLLRDASVRQRAEAGLREQALHDPLTGLANRALLHDRLTSAIAVAQRQDTPVSLLMLDLDGFKAVNDTWGHHAGDLVLIEIATRLSGTLRESDTAARLGGDEFVLMLPATPLVGAIETSRALVDFIVAPITIEGKPLTVGASIGIAVFPNHGRDAEVLLAAADSAMYDAKRSGGGYRTFKAHVGTTQP
jgi:diguanylate cyclase (GGDEF)-like protein/PAS domain S-box-containing protein